MAFRKNSEGAAAPADEGTGGLPRAAEVAAGGLLVAWSFVVPIFESPDEPHHWQYARHLHDERRLPPFSASFVEGNSPPLYYAIIAPVARATETPPGLVWHDAFGKLVIPFPPRFFHNAGGDLARYWPLRLARLITALLVLGAVVFVYLTGRELTGRPTTALLAAALVAFLPQFTFRGATISNDSLVTTLAAATTYFMVRILRRGFTWPVGILASIALAGAYLSKINAICLVPPLALTLLMGPGPWPARLRDSASWGWPWRSLRRGRFATSSSTATPSRRRRCARRWRFLFRRSH